MTFPVAAQVCSRSPAEIVGSNPAGCSCGCMPVANVVCYQLEVSVTGLITRTEASYRLWCVVVCDLETS